MKLICFRNGASPEVIPGATPWTNTTEIPKFPTKEAYRDWHSNHKENDAQHFSAMEGINSSMKIGFGNNCFRALGIVADYDAKNLSDSEIAAGLKRLNPAYPATAWNKTYSGGMRIVWCFERPVFYHSPKMWEWFMKKAAKDLKLKAAFPGLDDALFEKPGQTYVSGTGWHLTNNLLSKEFTAVLEYDACVKANDFGDKGDIEIPIEIVEKAVHEKFPGRWTGAFNLGARGVRFWSPEADNITGALVRANGMTAFTGNVPFMSWEQIFGRPFVQAYRESREGAILSTMYSDLDRDIFYARVDGKSWRPLNTEFTKRYLKSVHQISDSPPKGRQSSEVDDLIMQLKLRKTVLGALPFPHNPQETVKWAGGTFVNTSEIGLVKPAPEPGEFPWIKNAIEILFPDQKNREHFLAYIKIWYESCLNGRPRRGHASFIVGPPGTGKTFLTQQILGRMFGGFADLGPFIVDGDNFNNAAYNSVVWCIDDSSATDRKVHARLTNMTKACVANPSMKFDKKYGYKGSCPFSGRLLVTANDDVSSLSVLPDTNTSILDKMNLYRTGAVIVPMDADEYRRYEIVDAELPYFCRSLVDSLIPAWIKPNSRFGIESFHDPSLLQDARSNSNDHQMMEKLNTWRQFEIDQHRLATSGEKIKTKYKPWSFECQTAQLAQILNTHAAVKGMMPREVYPNILGKIISKSEETGSYPWIITKRTEHGVRITFHEIV